LKTDIVVFEDDLKNEDEKFQDVVQVTVLLKLFMVVIYECLRVFVRGNPFQPSLMLVG
jgi:hypothetical protein